MRFCPSALKERVPECIRETKAMRWLVVKQLPDKVEQHDVSLVRLRLDISLQTPPHYRNLKASYRPRSTVRGLSRCLEPNTAELAYVHAPAIVQLHIGQIPLGPVPRNFLAANVTRIGSRQLVMDLLRGIRACRQRVTRKLATSPNKSARKLRGS